MLRFLALSLLASVGAQAQISEPNFNGWFVYTGDHKFSETSKWGLHLEGQWRRNEVIFLANLGIGLPSAVALYVAPVLLLETLPALLA